MKFLDDLDAFFCEKYANYDMFCGMPQYRMPTMYKTEKDEYGRNVSYSLPKTEMRLSKQEKKDELLAEVKKKLICRDFSFSFQTVKWHKIFKHRFLKTGFRATAERVAARHNTTFEGLFEGTTVDKEIVEKIKAGTFLPTKNLLFAVALSAHCSLEDMHELMFVCDMDWDFTYHRDVVVRYLLEKSIFNADMVWVALKEYKVKYLYLKEQAE